MYLFSTTIFWAADVFESIIVRHPCCLGCCDLVFMVLLLRWRDLSWGNYWFSSCLTPTTDILFMPALVLVYYSRSILTDSATTYFPNITPHNHQSGSSLNQLTSSILKHNERKLVQSRNIRTLAHSRKLSAALYMECVLRFSFCPWGLYRYFIIFYSWGWFYGEGCCIMGFWGFNEYDIYYRFS